jgi:hypothetical protein
MGLVAGGRPRFRRPVYSTRVRDRPDGTISWRRGPVYLRRALAITRASLGVQLLIVAVYSSPALAAAYLSARPGTLAALEAGRVSGRHFGVCVSTLVAAGAPVALPLAGLAGVLVLTLPAAAAAAILAAAPDLVWAAIQAVRPVLIPAVYLLYADLQQTELARRQHDGEPPVPRLARGLLAFTRPLPHLGQPL